jgi:hypothetical protein
LTAALQSEGWLDFIIKMLDTDLDEASILHVWGHSWEIEEHKLWTKLEELFSIIMARRLKQFTIGELLVERTDL